MMNNTNNSNQLKITVSKTAPWEVHVNGKHYVTERSRSAARETAKDLRANGLPEHRADDDKAFVTATDDNGSTEVITGAQLEAIRRERKISLKSIAATMGVTAYRVWYTEKGKLPVTEDYVTKFDAALATA